MKANALTVDNQSLIEKCTQDGKEAQLAPEAFPLIHSIAGRNPSFFTHFKFIGPDQWNNGQNTNLICLQREVERLDLQQKAREAASNKGHNPDFIIAISSDEVVDFYAIIKVLQFGGASNTAAEIDDFMFDYLRVKINSDMDASMYDQKDISNFTWTLRRLRDAILYGANSEYLSTKDSGVRVRGEKWHM